MKPRPVASVLMKGRHMIGNGRHKTENVTKGKWTRNAEY